MFGVTKRLDIEFVYSKIPRLLIHVVQLFSPFLVHFSPLVLVLNRTRTGSPASRTGGLGLLGFA